MPISFAFYTWIPVDSPEEEIRISVWGVVHPAARRKINCDPWYAEEGSPAYAEINVEGVTRELTDSEYEDCVFESGERFATLEEKALEMVKDD